MADTRIAGSVDSTDLVEAVKDLSLSCVRNQEGVTVPVQAVVMLDPTKQPIGFFKNLPWGSGVPSFVRDAAVGSNKTFTVPAGKIWEILGVYVELTSTATVGNRAMVAEVTDGSNVIGSAPSGAVQAASLTNKYDWFPDAASMAAFVNAHITIGMNLGVLKAGHKVHVYDGAAIDAAADTMIVVLRYVEYDA